jgi:ABC-2 type transport system permease protein
MRLLNVFLYEYKHFARSKAKVVAYVLFIFASVYSLFNGFDLFKKHHDTLSNIEQKRQEGISKILTWFDEGKTGPEDRPWIDVTTPFWALWNTPTYAVKKPSALMPLGIGQAEQFGYYHRVTNWSTTYDKEMVEELSNPERLLNGNIDFSFLVIFLLPMLMIIFSYNIKGLEQDLNFELLVQIQSRSTKNWVMSRLSFYTLLLIFTTGALIIGSALINNAFESHISEISRLVFLSTIYILVWSTGLFLIIMSSKGSSIQAFKMISCWLIFCVLIPGAVHQLTSIKYPPNYMTDYLDSNRKDAYKMFEVSKDSLSMQMKELYPELAKTKQGLDTVIDKDIIDFTISSLINQNTKVAIAKIEHQNDLKNEMIVSSYWYNPVSYVQNKWNSITETDYIAYKSYRDQVQQAIDKKMKLLVFDCWDKKKVNKETFENYLKELE